MTLILIFLINMCEAISILVTISKTYRNGGYRKRKPKDQVDQVMDNNHSIHGNPDCCTSSLNEAVQPSTNDDVLAVADPLAIKRSIYSFVFVNVMDEKDHTNN